MYDKVNLDGIFRKLEWPLTKSQRRHEIYEYMAFSDYHLSLFVSH